MKPEKIQEMISSIETTRDLLASAEADSLQDMFPAETAKMQEDLFQISMTLRMMFTETRRQARQA